MRNKNPKQYTKSTCSGLFTLAEREYSDGSTYLSSLPYGDETQSTACELKGASTLASLLTSYTGVQRKNTNKVNGKYPNVHVLP